MIHDQSWMIALSVLLMAPLALRRFQDDVWRWRHKGRRALALAARLRSDLGRELDGLERRNRRLRADVRRATWPRRLDPSRSVFGPDLAEDFHAGLIASLRERAEHVYRVLSFEQTRKLEGQCQALADLMAEAGALAAEIGAREEARGLSPAAGILLGGAWRSRPVLATQTGPS